MQCRNGPCSVVNPRPQVNLQPDFLPTPSFEEKTLCRKDPKGREDVPMSKKDRGWTSYPDFAFLSIFLSPFSFFFRFFT